MSWFFFSTVATVLFGRIQFASPRLAKQERRRSRFYFVLPLETAAGLVFDDSCLEEVLFF